MDMKYLLCTIKDMESFIEDDLFSASSDRLASDEYRLAAALLLCTCDSNERKAGE